MKLAAYHNVATDDEGRSIGMLDGYQSDHQLVLVFETETTDDVDPMFACEHIYWLLNVGDDPDHIEGGPDLRAVAYRKRGNRSLSTGDVVTVDGTAYAVNSIGWVQVEPIVELKESRPLSTYLHSGPFLKEARWPSRKCEHDGCPIKTGYRESLDGGKNWQYLCDEHTRDKSRGRDVR